MLAFGASQNPSVLLSTAGANLSGLAALPLTHQEMQAIQQSMQQQALQQLALLQRGAAGPQLGSQFFLQSHVIAILSEDEATAFC